MTHGASRPVILTLINCLWPGNDASGPNQSLIALATALRDEFEFRIFTRDRPLGGTASTVVPGREIVDLGFGIVRYFEIGRFGARGLAQAMRETPHDLVWLNSAFDPQFSLPAIGLRRLRAVPRRPVLMSPRGEFGAGALAIKSRKKRWFLRFARAAGLWSDVTLHATSPAEAEDMKAGGLSADQMLIAPNVRLMVEAPPFTPAPGGPLRVIFVGRLVPIKNLDFALQTLARVRAEVAFEIYGPEEDQVYVQRCRKLAEALPPNIKTHWRGEASNPQILAALARSDLFFLPTGGENFGHAIFEALSAGVPVLISDRTPWRALRERRAGADLPLEQPDAFVDAIEQMAATSGESRAALHAGAREAAQAWVRSSDAVASNARMFRQLIGARAS